MKSQYFICLLLSVALQNCNTVTQISMNAKSDVKNKTIDSLNFTYNKKIIVVDAILENNQQAHSFIFDTGAFYSKVEKQVADNLKLPTVFTKSNSTAQGITKQVEMTSVNKLRLGKTAFQNIAAGKLVYAKKSYSPCLAKHGIIGANLIKLQNWKIDYQQQKLYFSDEVFADDKIEKSNTVKFSTSFLSGVPEIEINIEGKMINNVLFDLGFNGGLVVPKKFAKLFKDVKSDIYLDKSTSGIFGSNLDTLAVKQLEVSLGNSKSKIPVEFSSLNKALIGNDILEHFTIFLNYQDKKITLIPNSPIQLDPPKKLIPGILNDSLWIVNRTHKDIPLQIGDTLKSINGLKPKAIFKTHCDYFFKISEFLKTDTLNVETNNGNKINFSINQ